MVNQAVLLSRWIGKQLLPIIPFLRWTLKTLWIPQASSWNVPNSPAFCAASRWYHLFPRAMSWSNSINLQTGYRLQMQPQYFMQSLASLIQANGSRWSHLMLVAHWVFMWSRVLVHPDSYYQSPNFDRRSLAPVLTSEAHYRNLTE